MARQRNYYIRGASAQEGISPEARDLVANARTPENIDEWEREHGIGEPYRFTPIKENPDDIDDESERDMVYYPHKDEEPWPEDYEPSPVLLVKRMKELKGEPWWHKMACEKIGLGPYASLSKRVALPNMSYYTKLLYNIKVRFGQIMPMLINLLSRFKIIFLHVSI